jgi:hypothetical protein
MTDETKPDDVVAQLQRLADNLDEEAGDYGPDEPPAKMFRRNASAVRVAVALLASRDAEIAALRSRVAALEAALRWTVRTLEHGVPERSHIGSCVLGITDCDGGCIDRHYYEMELGEARALLSHGSTP